MSTSGRSGIGKVVSLAGGLILIVMVLASCATGAVAVSPKATVMAPAAPVVEATGIMPIAAGPSTGEAVAPTAAEPVAEPTAIEPTTIPTVVEPTSAPTAAEPVPLAAAEVTLSVFEHPALGKILVDGEGITLYGFTKDEPGKSNCFGECLDKWPPFLTQGAPILGEGVDPALVGTATLSDGSMIVTYNQMPLYYWYDDKAPGDTDGQDVGKVWYVVSPTGVMVMPAPQVVPTAPAADDKDKDKGGYDY